MAPYLIWAFIVGIIAWLIIKNSISILNGKNETKNANRSSQPDKEGR